MALVKASLWHWQQCVETLIFLGFSYKSHIVVLAYWTISIDSNGASCWVVVRKYKTNGICNWTGLRFCFFKNEIDFFFLGGKRCIFWKSIWIDGNYKGREGFKEGKWREVVLHFFWSIFFFKDGAADIVVRECISLWQKKNFLAELCSEIINDLLSKVWQFFF